MANPKLYGMRLIDATFTMTEAEDAAFPLANLSDYLPTLLWKSTTTVANQYLRMDLLLWNGSANKDFALVNGHNIQAIVSAGGRVQIGYAASSDFATSPVTIWDSNTDPIADPLIVDIASTTRRYWRVLYVNCGGIIPQVGNFFVGQVLDFGVPYNAQSRPMGKRVQTVEEEAIDGTLRKSQATDGRKYMEFSFKGGNTLSDAVKATFQTFFSDIARGDYQPFFFVDTDGTKRYVYFDMAADPTAEFLYNQNQIDRIVLKSLAIG